MKYYTVDRDLETADRVGAGGTFQVISLIDDEGTDITHLLPDSGRHYFSDEELQSEIAKVIGLSISEITIEE